MVSLKDNNSFIKLLNWRVLLVSWLHWVSVINFWNLELWSLVWNSSQNVQNLQYWRNQNDHLVYVISRKYTYSRLYRLFMAYFTRKKLLAYCWVLVTRKDFVNYFDSLDLLFTAWVIRKKALAGSAHRNKFHLKYFLLRQTKLSVCLKV